MTSPQQHPWTKTLAKFSSKIGLAFVILSSMAPLLLFALISYGTLMGPFPSECNALAVRFEYNRQVVLTMTGLQKDWDLPSLFSAMNASCNFQDQSNVPGPYQTQSLPELDAATDPLWREKLHHIITVNRGAVVVRNVTKFANDLFGDEAKEWSFDFLERRVYTPGTQVPVFMNFSADNTMEWIPFAELADELRQRNSTSKYGRCLSDRGGVIHSSINFTQLASMLGKEHQYKITNFIGGGFPACLFVGSDKVTTRAHSDTQSNAFVMIEGSKHWTFFPPSESMYMIPSGQGFNLAYNSLVDVLARHDPKQHAKFPLLKHARGFETTIHAGDVLFHSSFWWHGVKNVSPITVGLDIPFLDPITGFGANPVLDVGTALTPVVNPKALLLLIGDLLTADSNVKEVFFENYYKDNKQRETARKHRAAARRASLLEPKIA